MIFLEGLLLTYALWLFYLAAMNLIRVWRLGTMSLVAKALGAPIMLAAVVIDWLANWTVFSLLCWQWPAAWKELVTGRLKRYKDNPAESAYRKRISAWFASELLDQFDPTGKHV